MATKTRAVEHWINHSYPLPLPSLPPIFHFFLFWTKSHTFELSINLFPVWVWEIDVLDIELSVHRAKAVSVKGGSDAGKKSGLEYGKLALVFSHELTASMWDKHAAVVRKIVGRGNLPIAHAASIATVVRSAGINLLHAAAGLNDMSGAEVKDMEKALSELIELCGSSWTAASAKDGAMNKGELGAVVGVLAELLGAREGVRLHCDLIEGLCQSLEGLLANTRQGEALSVPMDAIEEHGQALYAGLGPIVTGDCGQDARVAALEVLMETSRNPVLAPGMVALNMKLQDCMQEWLSDPKGWSLQPVRAVLEIWWNMLEWSLDVATVIADKEGLDILQNMLEAALSAPGSNHDKCVRNETLLVLSLCSQHPGVHMGLMDNALLHSLVLLATGTETESTPVGDRYRLPRGTPTPEDHEAKLVLWYLLLRVCSTQETAEFVLQDGTFVQAMLSHANEEGPLRKGALDVLGLLGAHVRAGVMPALLKMPVDEECLATAVAIVSKAPHLAAEADAAGAVEAAMEVFKSAQSTRKARRAAASLIGAMAWGAGDGGVVMPLSVMAPLHDVIAEYDPKDPAREEDVLVAAVDSVWAMVAEDETAAERWMELGGLGSLLDVAESGPIWTRGLVLGCLTDAIAAAPDEAISDVREWRCLDGVGTAANMVLEWWWSKPHESKELLVNAKALPEAAAACAVSEERLRSKIWAFMSTIGWDDLKNLSVDAASAAPIAQRWAETKYSEVWEELAQDLETECLVPTEQDAELLEKARARTLATKEEGESRSIKVRREAQIAEEDREKAMHAAILEEAQLRQRV